MSTARVLNFPSFFGRSTQDVFEGGLEGMDGGIDLGIGCLRSYKAWLAAAVSSIHISKEGSRRDAAMGHRSVQHMLKSTLAVCL
jgi:hypothetical protein